MSTAAMGSIIILSGPAGAGKTTIAKEMIKASDDPTVHIEGDLFWFFIVKGFESRERIKNFKTIMASMTAAAVPYATAGYTVILDFSMPPWFLETAINITSLRKVPVDYIVIRPSEKLCAHRAATRAEGIITDYSSYHDLYTSFGDAKKFIIADDESSAAGIATRILKDVPVGKFRL